MPVMAPSGMVATVVKDSAAEGEEEAPETARANAYVTDSMAAPFDEDGPVWPDEAAEARFLSEQPIPVAAPPVKAAKTEPSGKLPALESLKERLGESTLAGLEELFRAKFVSVKRIPAGWLKESSG